MQDSQFIKILEEDSLFSSTSRRLSSGILAVGYIVSITHNTVVLGLVLALPYLAQLFQFAFLPLLRRFSNKKDAVVLAQLLSRLSLLLMLTLPLVNGETWQIVVVITSYFLFSLFDAFFSTFWNPLVKEAVPKEALTGFLSSSLSKSWLSAIVLTVVGGQLVGLWEHLFPELKVAGYALIWAVALSISFWGVYKLWKSPAPDSEVKNESEDSAWTVSTALAPLKDRVYRKVILYLLLWNGAIFLSTSFFSAYMLQMLHWPITMVAIITTLSMLTTWKSFGLAKSFGENRSARSMLLKTTPVYLICILAWIFTTMPDVTFWSMPLAVSNMILFGLMTSFVSLGNRRLALDLAPARSAETYLAINSITISLAAGAGALLGGALLQYAHAKETTFYLGPVFFNTWDVVFVVAALIGMVAMIFLSQIEDDIGEEPDAAAWKERLMGLVRRVVLDFH